MTCPTPLGIGQPQTAADLDAVRDLMRAFLAWHRRRHAQDRHLIDGYFDAAGFDRELAELPGRYAPPDGALLLARLGGRPVGCAALRRIGDEACEMKRMFVEPDARNHGIGRALSETLIALAGEAGYATILLDTSIRQHEAQALYRTLGFVDVPPYYELSGPLRDWLVFMRLDLHDRKAQVAAGRRSG